MSSELTTQDYNVELAQKLCEATIIRPQFKKLENMLVAMQIAKKLGIDVFSVTQNLDIIQGKAGWTSQFAIALINRESKASGLTSLRWKLTGEGIYGKRKIY